jgi:transcription elongation factor Elf1
MTTLDTRAADTASSCPRCQARTAYPAMVTVDRSPRFTLVCVFCGTARDLTGRT